MPEKKIKQFLLPLPKHNSRNNIYISIISAIKKPNAIHLILSTFIICSRDVVALTQSYCIVWPSLNSTLITNNSLLRHSQSLEKAKEISCFSPIQEDRSRYLQQPNIMSTRQDSLPYKYSQDLNMHQEMWV